MVDFSGLLVLIVLILRFIDCRAFGRGDLYPDGGLEIWFYLSESMVWWSNGVSKFAFVPLVTLGRMIGRLTIF